MCGEIHAHALTTTAKHEFMTSVGLYYFEAMVPPGLTNIAKNSVIQCFINHPTFFV